MKCETKIHYVAHDEDETSMSYPCNRTADKKVFYSNEGESVSVSDQPICGIHLRALEKKPFEIVVTDAK